jgi:hypothetical protein
LELDELERVEHALPMLKIDAAKQLHQHNEWKPTQKGQILAHAIPSLAR